MGAKMDEGNQTTTDVRQAESQESKDAKTLLRTHGIPIALGVCIVAAVFLVSGYRRTSVEKRTREASKMLFSAKTINDLSVVADQYSSTPAAPLALLKLAKSHFDTGNYNMAITKYNEFKQKFPDHMMVDAAELGKIHCMEAMSQFEQARAGFADFCAKHPNHFLTPEAVFGQARCLEQLGRYTEAKALYEDFVTANPKSRWIPRAKELLDSVSAKLREQEAGQLQRTDTGANPPAVVVEPESASKAPSP
jgi:tetratricopeptide (TPR) repeat protein